MSGISRSSRSALPCGIYRPVRSNRPTLTCVAIALAILALAKPAAGVVTGDNPDSPGHLVQSDSPYNMVGFIDRFGGCSGVLIGPRHVLTAGHVVAGLSDPSELTFSLELPDGTHVYTAAEVVSHPQADLALVTLAENTALLGYGLYNGFDEPGQIAAIVGYGRAGTGETGGYLPRGTKRIAWNHIDRAYYPAPGYDDVLVYDFDQFDGDNDGPYGGNSLGETLEGLVALGDSGGGLFLEVAGVPLLAGIHVEVLSTSGSGGDGVVGFYGDTALDVRVGKYISWLLSEVPGDANVDGRIDGADYTIWADNYGATGLPAFSDGGLAYGNFNDDDVVNGSDYTLWADNYLFGAGGGTRLPEPGTLALIGGGIWLLRRRG